MTDLTHHLSRAAAAQPARRLGRAAHRATRRCGAGSRTAGAGAIVLPSLFEEEIEHEAFAVAFAAEHGADQFGEALSFLPDAAAARGRAQPVTSAWSRRPARR